MYCPGTFDTILLAMVAENTSLLTEMPLAGMALEVVEMTDPSRSPSSHSDLVMLPGHSYALLSPAAPGIANYSTAAAGQSFAHSSLCTDHSDEDLSNLRRRRRCEGGVVGKTVWR